MSRQFLVDGYNVMYRLPGRGPAAGRTLEDGRAALIGFIRECRPQGRGADILTVVFDGREDVAGLHAEPGTRVVFTRATSADDKIRDMVEDAPDPRRVICVTDDRELALACAHRGAEVWTVARFLGSGRDQDIPGVCRKNARAADGDEKNISSAEAGRIARELTGLWLNRKSP